MTDRHKTVPKAVRMPDGLLARVEAALAPDEKVNAFIVAAIEREVTRREGGSTTSGAAAAAPAERVAPPRRTRKPEADTVPPVVLREPASRPAHAAGCKCLMCNPQKEGKR